MITQSTQRNVQGYKNSLDCYRTHFGVRYVGFTAGGSAADLVALRNALRQGGVRLRTWGGEIFVHEADRDAALRVAASLN